MRSWRRDLDGQARLPGGSGVQTPSSQRVRSTSMAERGEVASEQARSATLPAALARRRRRARRGPGLRGSRRTRPVSLASGPTSRKVRMPDRDTSPRPARRTRPAGRAGRPAGAGRVRRRRDRARRSCWRRPGSSTGRTSTASRASRNGPLASATNRLWKAAETGTGRVVIPRSAESRGGPRRSRAAEPGEDALPGGVLVGDDQVQAMLAEPPRPARSARRRRAWPPSRSPAQSAMSAPRRMGQHRPARASSIRPAAQRAVSSPKLWPATSVGPDAEVLEDAEQPQADRADRRLGEPRVAQGVLGSWRASLVERRGADRSGREARPSTGLAAASFMPASAACIAGNRQASSRSMPDVLRPLAGEEHRQAARAAGRSRRRPPSGAASRAASRCRSRRASDLGPIEQLGQAIAVRSAATISRAVTMLGPERARLRAGRLGSPASPRPDRPRAPPARERSPPRSSAEKARICTSPSQSIAAFSGSASSRTQWKLLPPKPKALTAARRGLVAARQPGAGLGVDVERRLAARQRPRPAGGPSSVGGRTL